MQLPSASSLGALTQAAIGLRCGHGEAQAADWRPDFQQGSGRVLLRRQDPFHWAAGRRGPALLPLAPAAVRQEPAAGHDQGTVRGQRGAFRRAGHPRQVGLGRSPSRSALELRRRRLQDAGLSGSQLHGEAGCRRAGSAALRRLCDGARPLRQLDRGAASQGRAGSRRPGGRIRQADPRRLGRAGGGARQSRVPARRLLGRQGFRGACALHVPRRREQVLQGEPVLRPQQPHGHHVGTGVFGGVRLH